MARFELLNKMDQIDPSLRALQAFLSQDYSTFDIADDQFTEVVARALS